VSARVEREDDSDRASLRDSQLLHVHMSRALDFADHRPPQSGSILSEKHYAIVDRLLLVSCQGFPLSAELVGEFDLPHDGPL